MKKHIFLGGGQGESECTVSPGDVHHFGFYKKKIREDWTKQVVR